MIGKIRPNIKPLTLIIAKPFAILGLHPNTISFIGIPLALIATYYSFSHQYTEALIFALLAVSMDLIDGSVAELTKKRSHFGNYFETMIDKYIEVILIAPFALLYPLAAFTAIGFSLIESYAKPRVAIVIITDNKDWPAIGEHGERLIIFLFGLFITIFYPVHFGYNIMEIALWLITILTLIGGIQRIFYAKKLIKEAEKNKTLLPYLTQGKERS